MNHFELFELACQFELDTSSLSTQYRELQRQYHPDKFATESAQMQRAAMQKSAQINDAYQTLRDPIARAEYLLSLNGVSSDNEQTVHDVDFLMQQLTLREQLDEIEQAQDMTALADFAAKIDDAFNDEINKLSKLLRESAWQAAFSELHKLKFIAKLQREIERIEELLF